MRRPQRHARHRDPAGFTLVELLIVIAIIGLIITLILVAAADGVRRAEERATQSLIIKLKTGINDRLDALSSTQAPVNQTHRYLAAITYQSGTLYKPVNGLPGSSGSIERRAQVIAQYDYLRAELPDVFFLNANTSDGAAYAGSYPLNFAASPYPVGSTGYDAFILPLGNYAPGLPLVVDTSTTNIPTIPYHPSPPFASETPPNSNYNPPPISGVFGASFSAAGSVYKNLYAAAASDVQAVTPGTIISPGLAYDGVDNNGNGFIDDLGEVQISPASARADFNSAVTARLAKHTHKTARAEMLYAILVEGLGPLGSVFTSDEFTNREVQDTDGDGLPEFIDAWGQPILFFRWPIYFGTVIGSSDSQKGSNPYTDYPDTRQLDPLDPNQLLVSPGWWTAAGNPALTTPTVSSFSAPNGNAAVSQPALAFMHYFVSLVDPYAGGAARTMWDRTGNYARRAYFSKFLVLSSGPDREPGVGQFTKDYSALTEDGEGSAVLFPNPNLTIEQNVTSLVLIENQASQSDPTFDKTLPTPGRTGAFFQIPNGSTTTVTSTTIYLQNNAGLDDISNHNTSAPSTGVR